MCGSHELQKKGLLYSLCPCSSSLTNKFNKPFLTWWEGISWRWLCWSGDWDTVGTEEVSLPWAPEGVVTSIHCLHGEVLEHPCSSAQPDSCFHLSHKDSLVPLWVGWWGLTHFILCRRALLSAIVNVSISLRLDMEEGLIVLSEELVVPFFPVIEIMKLLTGTRWYLELWFFSCFSHLSC